MSYLGETNSKDTDYSTANISIFNLFRILSIPRPGLRFSNENWQTFEQKIGEGFELWNKRIDNDDGIKLEEAILNPQIPT